MSALAVPSIREELGGGVMFSKYSGDSHSPKYESMRRTVDFVSSSRAPGTLGGTTRLKGSRVKSGLDWASPELRPMEV